MVVIFPHAMLAAAEKLLTCLIIAEEVVLLGNAKLDGVVSANDTDADAGEQAKNVWWLEHDDVWREFFFLDLFLF